MILFQVLIHVVDASGSADRDGVQAEGQGDPVDDIGWVQEVSCLAVCSFESRLCLYGSDVLVTWSGK